MFIVLELFYDTFWTPFILGLELGLGLGNCVDHQVELSPQKDSLTCYHYHVCCFFVTFCFMFRLIFTHLCSSVLHIVSMECTLHLCQQSEVSAHTL